MKTVIGMILAGFVALPAFANNKCANEAQLQARIFDANNNQLAVSEIKVTDWFFVEETEGVLYYGVHLNSQGFTPKVNVGLFQKDCSLAGEPNYVTDEYD